jgi:hypothetical protein
MTTPTAEGFESEVAGISISMSLVGNASTGSGAGSDGSTYPGGLISTLFARLTPSIACAFTQLHIMKTKIRILVNFEGIGYVQCVRIVTSINNDPIVITHLEIISRCPT